MTLDANLHRDIGDAIEGEWADRQRLPLYRDRMPADRYSEYPRIPAPLELDAEARLRGRAYVDREMAAARRWHRIEAAKDVIYALGAIALALGIGALILWLH